jgi:hypothetical protein
MTARIKQVAERDEEGNITRVVDLPAIPVRYNGKIYRYVTPREAEDLVAESAVPADVVGSGLLGDGE